MTYDLRNHAKRVSALISLIVVVYLHGRAQLTISVSTDKPVYHYGETILLLGTVTNQADTAVTVILPYQGPVTQVSFDNIRLSWILLPTELPYEFSPHMSRTSIFQIDGSRLGLPNKEGPHTLTCSFYWQQGGSSFSLRDSTIILQPAFYGGHLLVEYSVHTPPSLIQSLRDSMNAIVIRSTIYSETVTARWQTSGFILDSLVAKYTGDSRLTAIAADRSIASPTSIVPNVGFSPSSAAGYRLSQNFPNPFNPRCTIEFEIPTAQHVRLSVFDLLGRLVYAFDSWVASPGIHQVLFDGSHLASGIYVYELHTTQFSQTRRMLLIR